MLLETREYKLDYMIKEAESIIDYKLEKEV